MIQFFKLLINLQQNFRISGDVLNIVATFAFHFIYDLNIWKGNACEFKQHWKFIILSRWKRSYHVIGTENWYLLIFTHDNTDRVFSFEQFMIPSCETGHQLINLNLYR